MLYILCLSDITDAAQITVLDAGFQATSWLSARVLACKREVLDSIFGICSYIFSLFVNLEL